MHRVQSLKWFALAGLALGLTSCAKQKPVLDFALKDSTGKTVKLSDYRGKVVLLNFWATWCAPCKIEIPWFQEFQRQYKDQDFTVLGVSMDEDGWDSVRPYMADHTFNYPVVVGSDAVERLFGGIDDLPTTFLLDRGGHIALKHVGLISKKSYDDEITALVKGQVLKGAVPAASGAPVLALLRLPDQNRDR
jgi:peroxiredoxin